MDERIVDRLAIISTKHENFENANILHESEDKFRHVCHRLAAKLGALTNTEAPDLKSQSNDEYNKVLETFIRDQGSMLTISKADMSDAVARYRILDFLVAEIQAAQMLSYSEKGGHQQPSSEPTMGCEVSSSIETVMTRRTCKSVGLIADHYPTASAALEKVLEIANSIVKECPPNSLGALLLSPEMLNEDQRIVLSEISQAFRQEYGLRRQMLLKRLDVISQSFMSSERAKGKEAAMLQQVRQQRADLELQPSFSIYDIHCARGHILIHQKVAQTGSFASAIKSVPDRGGRPNDLRANKVHAEVRRANDAMRQQDQPRAKVNRTSSGPSTGPSSPAAAMVNDGNNGADIARSSSAPHQGRQGGKGRVQGAWGSQKKNGDGNGGGRWGH